MKRTTYATAWIVAARLTGPLGFVLLLVSGCGLTMDNEDRLSRGEQAYTDGDFRAAIIDAKDVLLDEPDNMRGRLLLGRASIEVGDGAAAEKEIRRAMQLGIKPQEVAAVLARALVSQAKFDEVLDEVHVEGISSIDAEITVRVVRGDAHMGLLQTEAAREMYLSVFELEPENLDARLGIVSTYVVERNYLQARGSIDSVLESFADSSRAWLYSGSFNMQVGDFKTAGAHYEVARELASSKNNMVARLKAVTGIAESLLERQDVESARPYVETLIATAPESLQTKLLAARIAYADQDWTLAQQYLQQILQVAPKFRPAQMLLGAVHLRSGNLSQAEMYLSSAVALRPDDVRARQLLAETQLQMQKSDAALESLAPIISAPDADLESLQMAARASLGRRDVDNALKFLRRSIRENPGNVDLQFQLAATLLRVGRNEEAGAVLDGINVAGAVGDAYRRDALRVLTAVRDGRSGTALLAAQQLVSSYSDRSGAFNLLGVVQLANSDPTAAQASFEQAVKLNSNDVVAHQYLAAIDEAAGKIDDAAARYEKILSDQPETTWAMAALGRIAFRREDYAAAVKIFKRASDTEPENADYRLSLAKAEANLGNSDAAALILEDEVSASLKHIPSAVMLGTLKAQAGDIAAAMDIAMQLQGRYPEDPASYAFEGEVHVIAGNMAAADAAYEKALSLGPVKSHALRSHRIKRELGVAGAERPLLDYLSVRPLDNQMRGVLAEAYMRSNNLGQSISAYERLVSNEPDNAVALNNLAWTYYLAEDPRAVGTARRARDAMPNNGAIVDTLGWIMIQQGSVAEGERLLVQAIEMENGRAEVHYHHAVALTKLGRFDEARVTLHRILESEEKFSSRNDAEDLLAGL
jgi:putative PEP-CTERM system TPR-repeat lipoprotein